MAGSCDPSDHPYLKSDNHEITGGPDPSFNCIAWAAGDPDRWWWPGPTGITYWPKQSPRRETADAFASAFRTLGYNVCDDGALEQDFEKVAIFARNVRGVLIPTHAARQLESGMWTSKMGALEIISHSSPEDVSGPVYGSVVGYLSRRRNRR